MFSLQTSTALKTSYIIHTCTFYDPSSNQTYFFLRLLSCETECCQSSTTRNHQSSRPIVGQLECRHRRRRYSLCHSISYRHLHPCLLPLS